MNIFICTQPTNQTLYSRGLIAGAYLFPLRQVIKLGKAAGEAVVAGRCSGFGHPSRKGAAQGTFRALSVYTSGRYIQKWCHVLLTSTISHQLPQKARQKVIFVIFSFPN